MASVTLTEAFGVQRQLAVQYSSLHELEECTTLIWKVSKKVVVT